MCVSTQFSFGQRITIENAGGNKANGQKNKQKTPTKLRNPGQENIVAMHTFPTMTIGLLILISIPILSVRIYRLFYKLGSKIMYFFLIVIHLRC